MSGGKIIPVIAQGDRDVRADVHSALVAAVAASDAQLLAAIGRVTSQLDALRERVEALEQKGEAPKLNG
jgi:predicted aconitase